MSLPNGVLSSVPVPGKFLPPDDQPFSLTQDWEKGGKAHQDPSMGIDYKDWTAWKDRTTGNIFVEPVDKATSPILITNSPTATHISLAFDRNMRLVVAWATAGTSYLYWFDVTSNTYTTSIFPSTRNPRLTHDDKREMANVYSDVLFFYIAGDNIVVRTQRDRYTIPLILGPVGPTDILTRVGMTDQLRVQIEVRDMA